MPIGFLGPQPPFAPAGNQALMDACFAAEVRAYLDPLVQIANLGSAQNMGVAPNGLSTDLGALPNPAPMPAPNPPVNPVAPVTDLVSLLRIQERQPLIDFWWQVWNGAAPGGTNASDQALLELLRDYLADPAPGAPPAPAPGAASYVLWKPQVAYDGLKDGKLRLRLLGYQALPLANLAAGGWDQANVQTFLEMLAAGAHFVVISAPRDLARLAPVPAVTPFYDRFTADLGPQSRAAVAHSHYGGLGPVTNLHAAWTYPALVNAEQAPANCPTLAAFLVGRTAWGGWLMGANFNTFFQLEGWPATGVTGLGGRHGADFNTHQATKWNISTFGASLYSEKRGTTAFLAPAGWNPQPQAGTVMAPYVGAETPQRWLDTALVRI